MPIDGTKSVYVEDGGTHAGPRITPEAVAETNGRPAGALARQVLWESTQPSRSVDLDAPTWRCRDGEVVSLPISGIRRALPRPAGSKGTPNVSFGWAHASATGLE